jgi:hypothetical protein
MSRPSSPPEAIFWAHVDVDGPFSEIFGTKCWMWTGTTNGGGYGQFDVSGLWRWASPRSSLRLGVVQRTHPRRSDHRPPVPKHPVRQARTQGRGIG